MDLKIADVAEMLNVSETTIDGWVEDGTIPSYRMDDEYRFSRMEIENWVMTHKMDESDSSFAHQVGSKQFGLYRAIHKGDVIVDMPGEDKRTIIQQSAEIVAPKLEVDTDILSELLIDRENLMPTALGHGIAIPHARDLVLKGPFDILTVVFPAKPIHYGALDGEPVHTLFFLFARNDKNHLNLLAKIAHLSNDPKARELLAAKPSKSELLEFIRHWETEISKPKE